MLPLPEFYLVFLVLLGSLALESSSQSSTIYEVLVSNGLPKGLFPKGVKNFTLNENSGKFEVYLDQPCNLKIEDEFHYDRNVSGTLSYGRIGELSGISAEDLFLWFAVKEIKVDVPSSGLIYFDVGVVYKQFSLSSFETPKECKAVQLLDRVHNGMHITDTLLKGMF